MIEMRWIKRIVGDSRKGPIFFQDNTFASEEIAYTRVLQYRYRQPKMTDRVGAYPPRDWEWSEWIEVAD
jgi:hypothetical protein